MKSSKAFSHGDTFADRPSEAESMFFAGLRITLGVVMITHGIPKAMRASHGSMADPWSGSINLIQNVMGLPFAPQLAFLMGALALYIAVRGSGAYSVDSRLKLVP